VNGYPLHPTEQNMISAAGIKDQGLTIIVTDGVESVNKIIELPLVMTTSRATFSCHDPTYVRGKSVGITIALKSSPMASCMRSASV